MFGSFPTQESVNELEHEGVRYFIDLTDNEKEKKITSYTTKYTYINYPIKDNYVPIDLATFTVFIIKIAKIIKNLTQEKVYIHCKGGHGRSGVVVSCLLCYIFKLTPYESLEYTTKCHNNRHIMRDKWRKIGSPQTYLQNHPYKFFLIVLFEMIPYCILYYMFLNDNFGWIILNTELIPVKKDHETIRKDVLTNIIKMFHERKHIIKSLVSNIESIKKYKDDDTYKITLDKAIKPDSDDENYIKNFDGNSVYVRIIHQKIQGLTKLPIVKDFLTQYKYNHN
jgi:hypothetical protein